MRSRVIVLAITVFWLAMNVSLVRKEFGAKQDGASPVPEELVWGKILSAPDSSSLAFVHRGRRVGLCHWTTGTSREWAEVSDENLPPGAPRKSRGYELHVDGSAVLDFLTNRVRFQIELQLDSTRRWQKFNARVDTRAARCEVRASAPDETVLLKADAEGAQFERSFRFSELQNPAALLRGIAGPVAGEWLGGLESSIQSRGGTVASALKWEAFEDYLRIGRSRMPVYRLQTRVLNRYVIRLFVSRVGEILRIELPNDLELRNDLLLPS